MPFFLGIVVLTAGWYTNVLVSFGGLVLVVFVFTLLALFPVLVFLLGFLVSELTPVTMFY